MGVLGPPCQPLFWQHLLGFWGPLASPPSGSTPWGGRDPPDHGHSLLPFLPTSQTSPDPPTSPFLGSPLLEFPPDFPSPQSPPL